MGEEGLRYLSFLPVVPVRRGASWGFACNIDNTARSTREDSRASWISITGLAIQTLRRGTLILPSGDSMVPVEILAGV